MSEETESQSPEYADADRRTPDQMQADFDAKYAEQLGAEAFDAQWWFETEPARERGFGTLRVKAIEVTVTVGDASRKTRYEFEGGGVCEILSPGGIMGGEPILQPLDERRSH